MEPLNELEREYLRIRSLLSNTDSNGMVNTTEVAKTFRKYPKNWLRTGYAKRFIEWYSEENNTPPDDLVVVKNGNNGIEIWMQRAIAVEFARWLSPYFSIWCIDRTKELFKYGFTGTTDIIEEMITNPESITEHLTSLKEECKAGDSPMVELFKSIMNPEAHIQPMKEKVEFAQTVKTSDGMILINQAAEIIGLPFRRKTLTRKLLERGILFGCRNQPKQKYVNAGYFTLKSIILIGDEEAPKVVTRLFVSEKGLNYLRKIFIDKK